MKKFIVTIAIEEFRDYEIEAESEEALHPSGLSEKAFNKNEALFEKISKMTPVNVRVEYEGISAIEVVKR